MSIPLERLRDRFGVQAGADSGKPGIGSSGPRPPRRRKPSDGGAGCGYPILIGMVVIAGISLGLCVNQGSRSGTMPNALNRSTARSGEAMQHPTGSSLANPADTEAQPLFEVPPETPPPRTTSPQTGPPPVPESPAGTPYETPPETPPAPRATTGSRIVSPPLHARTGHGVRSVRHRQNSSGVGWNRACAYSPRTSRKFTHDSNEQDALIGVADSIQSCESARVFALSRSVRASSTAMTRRISGSGTTTERHQAFRNPR